MVLAGEQDLSDYFVAVFANVMVVLVLECFVTAVRRVNMRDIILDNPMMRR